MLKLQIPIFHILKSFISTVKRQLRTNILAFEFDKDSE